jgi:hypothetical protein
MRIESGHVGSPRCSVSIRVYLAQVLKYNPGTHDLPSTSRSRLSTLLDGLIALVDTPPSSAVPSISSSTGSRSRSIRPRTTPTPSRVPAAHHGERQARVALRQGRRFACSDDGQALDRDRRPRTSTGLVVNHEKKGQLGAGRPYVQPRRHGPMLHADGQGRARRDTQDARPDRRQPGPRSRRSSPRGSARAALRLHGLRRGAVLA